MSFRKALEVNFALWGMIICVLMSCTQAKAQAQVRPCFEAGAGNCQNMPGAGANVTPVDCSGVIASGGVAQPLWTATTTVRGFMILNIDTTEPLWINFNGTAAAGTQGSYPLQAAAASTFASPGSFYSQLGYSTAPSVVAATTNHKYTCTRW